MMRPVVGLQISLIVWPILIISFYPVCGQQAGEGAKKKIEATSPDGKFAFKYTKESKSDADADTNSESSVEKQTYDLIDKKSGKVLMSVAESDPDMGPSARFVMEGVLWKPDSKAFALTAYLWKRGTSVSVFVRKGDKFRKIELPELTAEISEEAKKGNSFPHISDYNSQSAKRWQKDGSLVVEIETTQDGNDEDLTITANRTVVLGFDGSDKAKILKSVIKYKIEKPMEK
jgi:hypothetical protein